MTPVYRSLHMRGNERVMVGNVVHRNVLDMVARELYAQVITIQAKITDQTMIVCRIDIQ